MSTASDFPGLSGGAVIRSKDKGAKKPIERRGGGGGKGEIEEIRGPRKVRRLSKSRIGKKERETVL